jgi:hypothetical protein
MIDMGFQIHILKFEKLLRFLPGGQVVCIAPFGFGVFLEHNITKISLTAF